MAEVLSQDEIDQLLTAINANETGTDGPGRPMVIDYRIFCSRLSDYGFNKRDLAEAKAALLEAHLACRFFVVRRSADEEIY
jgi:hypothetical protein